MRICSRFPNGAPMERITLTGHFYVSLNVSLFIFPSECPVREPPPFSLTGSPMDRDTPSPEPLVYLFMHSLIHVCLPESPKRSLLHMGKNIRSQSMEPHADRRPTHNGVRPGSPTGSLMTLLSLPQCHAALGTIPSTLAWVDQSPISQRVL